VEVPNAERGGMQRVGRSGEEDKKAAKRFTEAMAHVKPAAETVLNAFKEMNTPDEIALEFGVKFSGKVGEMLASVDSFMVLRRRNPCFFDFRSCIIPLIGFFKESHQRSMNRRKKAKARRTRRIRPCLQVL